ncbi:MAG TPA: DUF882 domain-containing protein [Burkholderiaceae bacterium]|nr:DUF882 domain-containing protein [Burkholderiaceae bacterium]
MNDPRGFARRHFLKRSAGIAAGSVLPLGAARAGAAESRSLAFVHTHTHERLQIVYAVADRYVPDALASLNRFLRDHYSGEVGAIDPRLFDLLHQVQQLVGGTRPFEVISGYRCAATNAMLRETRGGGVARTSLHMEGRAIDVRLPDVVLADLRDAAVSLKAGGVGFYPGQFVHIDTGRVRRW